MTPPPKNQQDLILTRLQELLGAQQERFQLCLAVLHKQKEAITQGRVEQILVCVEREEQITGEILAIQKVIEPLEAAAGKTLPSKRILEELRQAVRLQLEQNKELLSQQMSQVTSDIKALKESPLRRGTPLYVPPSFIDQQG